jgi:hypothetical protein
VSRSTCSTTTTTSSEPSPPSAADPRRRRSLPATAWTCRIQSAREDRSAAPAESRGCRDPPPPPD